MASIKLVSTELISPEAQSALPEGYKLRSLQRNDFENGHLAVLDDLAFLGDITKDKWIERFDYMRTCAGTYYVVVIEDPSRKAGNTLVATATLMVEKKLLGTQGHIEDVAVIADQQGKKLGVRLLAALDFIAHRVGCYKTILDCSPENEGFYVKCRYEKAGSEMHRYFDAEAEKEGV